MVKKIIILFLVVLTLVIIGELFCLFTIKTNSSVQTKLTKNNDKQTKQRKTPQLSEEELSIIHDPYYHFFFPIDLDEEKNKLYFGYSPKTYVEVRKRMGVNLAALATLTTYTKDQIDYIYVIERLSGTISKLDTSNSAELYFRLSGKQGITTEYYYNEHFLKKTKFVSLKDNQEKPMDWKKELKDGDSIIMEEKIDLTKPPNDPDYTVEAKFSKIEP
jgi:hypothetical protein